jgi:hypothetical protein
MAVVQISKIQIRRGQKNTSSGLPQLASGELAWAIDTQELYIGSGAVSEGAPYVDNIKILTEQDNLLELVGTYQFAKNNASIQTGPSANQPVVQTLQNVIDQFVTASNFGVVGDGVVDDTAAIQRAIDQLYLNPAFQGIPSNPGAREEARTEILFGPGNFRITSTIYLPSYCFITGSGAQHTFFKYEGDDVAFKFVNTNSTIGEYTTADVTPTNQPKYIILRDFTISCSSGLASGLELNCVANSKFENISIRGSYLWDADNYTVTGTIGETGLILKGGNYPNADTKVTALRSSGGANGQLSMIMSTVSGIKSGARVEGTGIAAGTIVTNVNVVTKEITLSLALTAQSAGTYTFIVPADTYPTTLLNLFNKVAISGFAVCVRGESNIAYNNFTNCDFSESFYGVYLGYGSTAPVNNTISYSSFRHINKEGLYIASGSAYGNISLNNKFVDVGTDGGNFNVNAYPIIYFGAKGNQTIGDIFDRQSLATQFLNNTYKPEVDGITYFVNSGPQQTTVSQVLSQPVSLIRIPVTSSGCYEVSYKYFSGVADQFRKGKMSIAVNIATSKFEFVDEYDILSDLNNAVEIDESLVFSGAIVGNSIVISYVNSQPGEGTVRFVVSALT